MFFEFATAGRILFGEAGLETMAQQAKAWGDRALLVTGRSQERVAPVQKALSQKGITTTLLHMTKEPTIEAIQEGVDIARQADCLQVIGVGGGSAIDAGKAIAALLTNEGEPLDYLEVIGKGLPLKQAPAPYIAIPTTAGTGAEVTRNAVLTSVEHQVKVSMRSAQMLPRLAVVIPSLTHSMPPEVTASTGLDALTQLIEPFVSHTANPLTDAICREGIRRAARSLRRAYHKGDDAEARTEMAFASLCGGLALANAKLGAVHGFAGPLGGMFPTAPHGVICARFLPHVMEINVRALQERDKKASALLRYEEVAQLLTQKADATVEDGIAWIKELCQELAVPTLSSFGVNTTDAETLLPKVQASSSMKGNPIQLTQQELAHLLQMAL